MAEERGEIVGMDPIAGLVAYQDPMKLAGTEPSPHCLGMNLQALANVFYRQPCRVHWPSISLFTRL